MNGGGAKTETKNWKAEMALQFLQMIVCYARINLKCEAVAIFKLQILEDFTLAIDSVPFSKLICLVIENALVASKS